MYIPTCHTRLKGVWLIDGLIDSQQSMATGKAVRKITLQRYQDTHYTMYRWRMEKAGTYGTKEYIIEDAIEPGVCAS